MSSRTLACRFAVTIPILLLVLPSLPVGAATVPGQPAFVPGRLIVGFHGTPAAAVRAGVHAQVGAREVRALVHPSMDLAIFDETADLAALQEAYRARPEVELAEPDWIGSGGVVPTSTWYSEQWHHHNTGQSGGTPGADIESESGWDLSRGSPTIVVAVLDSGIDSDHPDFAGRILPGWDYVNGDADPEDDLGHGTGVTALLAANADDGFGVAGVDHACRILPVKVLDQFNSGTTSNLINGLGFATLQGADVISMSLIDYPCAGALINALRDAKLAGAILVACAGNGGIGDADVSCPGASTHTISIGATTDIDSRAHYSGTGNALDFVAPGDLVITALYGSSVDDYSIFAGCSAATPVAAGIVSVLRGVAEAAGVDLRSAQVRSILEDSAEDLVGAAWEDTAGWDSFMGWGRLNLQATLQTFLARTAAPAIAAAGGLSLDAVPNPARGPIALRFALPAPAWIEVTLYDVAGRVVRVLAEGARPAGGQDIRWDGTDSAGAEAAPGVYFARLEAGGHTVLQKVTLVR